MSKLSIALTRPTEGSYNYSEKALKPETKILHSSGEFSKKNWLQRRVIQFFDFIRKDSPYHTVQKANQIAEVVERELKTQPLDRKRFAESHLGALERDFIAHSSEKSHAAIYGAFARAKQAVSPPRVEAVESTDPLPMTTIDNLMEEYFLTMNHINTGRLYQEYSQKALTEGEITYLRFELSKLGLQELIGEYGEELVRSVVPNFDRIERGEEFLDLKHNDEDRGRSVIVRLTDAKVKRDRQIKVNNERFLGRMIEKYGKGIVSEVAGKFKEESANRVGFGYERGEEFEAHCLRAQRMAASEQEIKEHKFLHSGLFNDLLFIPGMEGQSIEAVQAEVMTGIAGQDTATCVKWVRHVFSKEAGDQIIAQAFNAMQVEMTVEDTAKVDGSNINHILQVDAALEENFGEGTFSGKISAGDAFESAVMELFASRR